MYRLAFFLLVLMAAAIGFAWLADHPGTVTVQWPWLNQSITASLLQTVIAISAILVLAMMVWWVVSAVLHSPQTFGRWRAGRRRDKGYAALSKGLIAAGSGDATAARKLTKEATKLLGEEPMVDMLDAQTLLLEGNRSAVRDKFQAMSESPDTKLLGLRGLYLEAEKENEPEAAAHFAREANDVAPGTPWATQAVLRAQAASGEWQAALKTLELNRSSGVYDKPEYTRKRAVILTALAMSEELTQPDMAKSHALAAHKLVPGLVPAATTAARLASRLGDMRKAAKVLETTWKLEPHPELADVYVHLRSGDSALDRLKRAETLAQKRSNHVEGMFAIAKAALDAGEYDKAREAMEGVLRNDASERACLLMADIEEAEHGDRGRVREWLSRAVSAPRDAAWTADGIVSETWKPYSPISGRVDAFEWRVPVEQLGAGNAVDYSKLAREPLAPLPTPEPKADDAAKAGVAISAAAASVAATAQAETSPSSAPDAVQDNEPAKSDDVDVAEKLDEDANEPTIIEAEIVEFKPAAEKDAVADEEAPLTEEAADEKADNAPVEVVSLADVQNAKSGSDSDANKPAAKSEKPKSAGSGSELENASPYSNADFDPDEDGVIDRRPDDPGIGDEETKAPKKGLFF